MYVIVLQEDKSDKEKKKKRKVIYCYTIKVHSRDQDSVKLKIIKSIVYADDLVSQSRWFKPWNKNSGINHIHM
jgi:hypothetical protein